MYTCSERRCQTRGDRHDMGMYVYDIRVCAVWFIANPWCTCGTARVTVLGLYVCVSVCYHVFCNHAQQPSQMGHWQIQCYTGLIGDLKTDCLKWKASEQANMQTTCLPRPHSACLLQWPQKLPKKRANVESRDDIYSKCAPLPLHHYVEKPLVVILVP